MKQTIKLNTFLILGFIFFQNFIFAKEKKLNSNDGNSGITSSITGDDLIFVNEKREKIALSDLKGKVVFVNFWATWCRPCVEEMTSINELKKKFKDKDIVFVMLNIEADLEKAKKFMVQRKLDLPVYVVGKTVSPDLFKNVVPTTLIYNKEGKLEGNIQGMMDFNDPKIYEAIKQLLEK